MMRFIYFALRNQLLWVWSRAGMLCVFKDFMKSGESARRPGRAGILVEWLRCCLLPVCAAFLPAASHAQNRGGPETEVQYLSGTGYGNTVEWEFFCTGGRNSGKWTTIGVPSCWEQEGFGTYQYGIGFYGKETAPGLADEQGKYRYEFEVPEEWRGRRVRIVFDGSMTDTEVWINGQDAGPTHRGGFYRFKYDITNLLKFGQKNVLEATVSKESEDASVNLAERRADYWNFGGIFRPVFLEALPAGFISRTAIDADADGSFLAEVYLGSGAGTSLSVKAQLSDSEGKPVGEVLTATAAPGADKMILEGKFAGIRNWTAETPHLYNVEFTMLEDGAPKHTVRERFGFRTFEVREGDGLYLNGQKIILKGINRHSFWPESGRTLNKELNYADVRLMKEMNMNSVRMSHYPPDPEFLDACDELGLYVLNELGGWHGHYDEGVGNKLVGELVRRDVNHPSIIFWDNGNEGGWNTALDDEFAKWDPQDRPVLHPQQSHDGVETMHYRSYGETEEYLRGAEIFLPTEFLHGLYDGGHGAGLWDYWELMRRHPRCAGGFLWVFSDEGIARTDQDGRIDNSGNYGADGIVGPHREKEGSFYTVKEIWSPVQVRASGTSAGRGGASRETGGSAGDSGESSPENSGKTSQGRRGPEEISRIPSLYGEEPGREQLSADFQGAFRVENRYSFINLSQCSFSWSLGRFPGPAATGSGHETIAGGEITGPAVAPGGTGELKLPLPANWKEGDVLYLAALDPQGDSLWTWSWSWEKPAAYFSGADGQGTGVQVREEDDLLVVTSASLELAFNKKDGLLAGVSQQGKKIAFGNGPRFIAARRGDRTLDGSIDPDAPKGVDRVYNEIKLESKLADLKTRREGEDLLIEASYSGALNKIIWRISPGGVLRLDYEYTYNGAVELMGVCFDYPETGMEAIRWLGRGPYRSWQNRIHGTKLNVWKNEYNDPIPGETFLYPEFKGYFRGWRWAEFETEEGMIRMAGDGPGTYLGVYTPRDGRDLLLYTLPETGIAILDVIPAVRNKVNSTDLNGPSARAMRVSGSRRHTVWFRFEAR